MTDEKRREFEEVCDLLLRDHLKGKLNGVQTLNRLFRKNINGIEELKRDAPVLSHENVRVCWEVKQKQEYAKLGNQRADKGDHDCGEPITILRYRGKDRLLDGNHRCRHWMRHKVKGDHKARILEVLEMAADAQG